MLDQEKRYVFGLTQAVSQIEDSFERLHARFTDIENRVSSFETVCGRLSYRLETTLHAAQERADGDPQLATRQDALQAAVDGAVRKLAEHTEAIRFLTEENRTLREALAGAELNSRHVGEEVARAPNEDAASKQGDTVTVSDAAKPGNSRSSSPEADKTAALGVVGTAAAAPEPSGRAPHDRADADPTPVASEDDIDHLIAEISRSIDDHKSELQRMREQTEGLLARIASTESAPPRLAIDRIDADKQDVAPAGSRAASERKLVEIKRLSSAYEALVQDLEKSRAALIGHSPATPDAPSPPAQEARQEALADVAGAPKDEAQDRAQGRPPDAAQVTPAPLPKLLLEPKSLAGPDSPPEPECPRQPDPEPVSAPAAQAPAPHLPQPPSAVNEINKINSLRAMYEKRTEDLKAELMMERRERQFAESSLQVSRAERLQLQRELAKYRAMGWRKITPEGTADPAPSHDPEAVRRRTSAA